MVIIRTVFSIILLYFVWVETGVATMFCLFLIMIAFEGVANIVDGIRKDLKLIKEDKARRKLEHINESLGGL